MMSKIDTTQWKEFVIGELFDIHPTKAYKLTNSRLYDEDGNNPVVVNSIVRAAAFPVPFSLIRLLKL